MSNVINPTLKTEIDKLVVDRKAWEAHLVVSNKKLYEVLAGCTRLTETFTLEDLKAAVSDFKIRSDTSKFLIAVKLVLGTDNQKASAYAKAIENGVSIGKSSIDIAAWLLVTGVEKARTLNSTSNSSTTKTTSTAAQPAAASNNTVSSPVIADDETSALERANEHLSKFTGGFELPSGFLPSVPFGDELALLVTAQPNGQLVVTFATVNSTCTAALKRTLGRELLGDFVSAHSTVYSQVIDDEQAKLDALVETAKN